MNKGRVETIYPLSPMQEGMLFHTLYAPDAQVYFQQLSATLHGNLVIPAFKQAWQIVMSRHAALRTAFAWEGRDKPLQIVLREVTLPWEEHDLRELSPAQRQEALAALIEADRSRNFILAQAPLMRLTLAQLTNETTAFIWSRQHMILDGWSVPLVFREVFAAYEAMCQGKPFEAAPARPYADYIAWLQKQDHTQAEVFWRQTLKGFSAPTPLGAERTQWSAPSSQHEQQVEQDTGYAEEHLFLSEATSSALQSLVRQHKMTLNTLMQGAWAMLLSRYSGEVDVVFGATVSGRPATLPGVESIVGLFINTLPIRVQVTPEANLLPWLKQLQMQQAELLQYEYSPLVQVQGWSEVPRGTALFESILIFENYPSNPSLRERDIQLEFQDMHSLQRTNYPLTVMAIPGDRFFLQIAYNTGRFEPASIQRMLGHLQTLLESMAAHPNQHLSDVPLLTADERQQILVEWNDTPGMYATNRCVHQLFEAQATQTPNATALLFENKQLSFQELNQRANALAHYLRTTGVGPDTQVGISVDRSLEMVVGILGILKAGGAYVPLDPAYPVDRLAFMLEDAQAPILLTQQSLLAQLPEHRAKVVCLDTHWQAIVDASSPDANAENNPESGVQPNNLAYVIYTSGSTGKPKGVQVSHRAIGNRLLWGQSAYPLAPEDRVLQIASFSFDIAFWEIFGPLLAGAQVLLARPGGQQDPGYLLSLMADEHITSAHFVPSLLQVLTEDERLANCRALRVLFCGGEAVPVDLPQRVFAQLDVDLHQFYGPTEAAINATYWDCQRDWQESVLPIGRPISNMQIYLLDSQLQPVPVGVAGEVYIGGIGLARGYLNRPELTAERFIPSPFANINDTPGARLYRTGDVARLRPDGSIEYVGRSDFQVKIRGFRIEPGEIETVFRQHPAVYEVEVLARADIAPGEMRLVAYIVLKPSEDDSAPTATELRRFVQQKLPDYMVPSAFMLLDALPLSPNGKLDRQALPLPDAALMQREGIIVAPRDGLEFQLVRIFEEVLNVAPIGVTDNFFDLGGHSLLAVRLMARIQQQFGQSLSLSTLFEGGTVEQLAQEMRQQTQDTQVSSLVRIQARGAKRPIFCVHAGAGNVLCYTDLARYLGPDQPVYGFQAAGMYGECKPYSRIEGMAAHYIESMRTVQPEGPYQLLGWCLGGLIAFEMAQQLTRQGEEISFLAVLDTFPAGSHALDFLKDEVSSVMAFMGDFIRPFTQATSLYTYRQLKELTPTAREEYLMGLARQIDFLPPDAEPTQLRSFLDVYRLNAEAMYSYQLSEPYPHRIIYFQALDNPESPEAISTWRTCTTEPLELYQVPGNHGTLIREPNVRILADQLQHCLESVATPAVSQRR